MQRTCWFSVLYFIRLVGPCYIPIDSGSNEEQDPGNTAFVIAIIKTRTNNPPIDSVYKIILQVILPVSIT